MRYAQLRRSNLSISAVVAGLALFGCVAAGGWGVQGRLSKAYAGIAIGQSKEQVIASLGRPARESEAFQLPQNEGYEAIIVQAKNSGASTFLYWDSGEDEVAVVGLNEQGRVVFRCRAGT
jgi:hypothetical protein